MFVCPQCGTAETPPGPVACPECSTDQHLVWMVTRQQQVSSQPPPKRRACAVARLTDDEGMAFLPVEIYDYSDRRVLRDLGMELME